MVVPDGVDRGLLHQIAEGGYLPVYPVGLVVLLQAFRRGGPQARIALDGIAQVDEKIEALGPGTVEDSEVIVARGANDLRAVGAPE